MQRWAARIEYLGTRYSGWQKLPQARTVQAELEAALSKIATHPVTVVAAGRTDSGVHGLGQVVHFDSTEIRRENAWTLGVNVHLPDDISVRWAQPVPPHFSARHLAMARSYRYVIHNSRTRSGLLADRVTFWPRQLDAAAMHEAAQQLVGKHDFSAFRDAQCQAPTPVRMMHSLDVFRRGEFVVIDVRANAFLHHMVRNLAGTLGEVGKGKQTIAWVAAVLASRQRKCAGPTAPSDGLYFIGPEYPTEFGLPLPPKPWFPDTTSA